VEGREERIYELNGTSELILVEFDQKRSAWGVWQVRLTEMTQKGQPGELWQLKKGGGNS